METWRYNGLSADSTAPPGSYSRLRDTPDHFEFQISAVNFSNETKAHEEPLTPSQIEFSVSFYDMAVG
jgi:hypothetical protein